MKDFFKPEDFPNLLGLREQAAEDANEKLNKLIESWPVVYGNFDRGPFPMYKEPENKTHKARLAFIEEIHKEPCPHRVRLNSFSWVDGKTREVLAKTQMTSHCELCGVELQATWREKK